MKTFVPSIVLGLLLFNVFKNNINFRRFVLSPSTGIIASTIIILVIVFGREHLGPWTVRMFLGTALGITIGLAIQHFVFIREKNGEIGSWQFAGWTSAMGVLIFLGVAGPSIDRWLTRAESVKFGVLELTLSTKQQETRLQALSEEARTAAPIETSLAFMEIMPGSITKDRYYQELLYDGRIAEARNEKERSELEAKKNLVADLHDSAIFFMKDLILPLEKCVKAAWKKKQDVEMTREFVRPFSTKLWQLVSAENFAWQQGHLSSPSSQTLSNELVVELEQAIKNLTRSLVDEDAQKKCRESLESVQGFYGEWPLYLKPAGRLLTTPYVHLALKQWLEYAGNLSGGIAVLEEAANREKDENTGLHVGSDANLLLQLSRLHHSANTPLKDVTGMYIEALENATKTLEKIRRLSKINALKPCKTEIQRQIERFEFAQRAIKNEIAYYGIQDTGESINYSKHTLLKYAEENYECVIGHTDGCSEIPDRRKAMWIDTYGYVLMSLAVREASSDSESIEQTLAGLRKAERLFQEARKKAAKASSDSFREQVITLIDKHIQTTKTLIADAARITR